jgi:hypothetical protein
MALFASAIVDQLDRLVVARTGLSTLKVGVIRSASGATAS